MSLDDPWGLDDLDSEEVIAATDEILACRLASSPGRAVSTNTDKTSPKETPLDESTQARMDSMRARLVALEEKVPLFQSLARALQTDFGTNYAATIDYELRRKVDFLTERVDYFERGMAPLRSGLTVRVLDNYERATSGVEVFAKELEKGLKNVSARINGYDAQTQRERDLSYNNWTLGGE